MDSLKTLLINTTDGENMSTNQHLKQLVEALVVEALRGFNFNKFKALPSLDAKTQYARQSLPLMGEGSSRIVFAFSGGKALKIATGPKGFAQNQAEIEIFTDPATKPVVARIFDADTAKNEWLIAEIVQPFQPTKATWQQHMGFDFQIFGNVINDWDDAGMPDETAYLQNIITKWQNRMRDLVKIGQEHGNMYKVTQTRLKNYLRIAKSPIAKGVMHLIRQGLVTADLVHMDGENTSDNVIGHYGKTVDGRIVLLDYGYSKEVYDTHYKEPEAPATPADPSDVRFYSATNKT